MIPVRFMIPLPTNARGPKQNRKTKWNHPGLPKPKQNHGCHTGLTSFFSSRPEKARGRPGRNQRSSSLHDAASMVLVGELSMPMPDCSIFQERRLGATARAKQHRQEACLHRFKGFPLGSLSVIAMLLYHFASGRSLVLKKQASSYRQLTELLELAK